MPAAGAVKATAVTVPPPPQLPAPASAGASVLSPAYCHEPSPCALAFRSISPHAAGHSAVGSWQVGRLPSVGMHSSSSAVQAPR